MRANVETWEAEVNDLKRELGALRRECDAWQDKAGRLENELIHLQRLEANTYAPQGRELEVLRAALRRFKAALRPTVARAEYVAAQNALAALATEAT